MLKKIWDHPFGKLLVVVLTPIATALGTYLLGLWPIVMSWLKAGWAFFFQATQVANVLLIVICSLALIGLGILVFAIWANFFAKGERTSWQNYTEDTFYGLRWRWRFSEGRILNLNTFCPHCDYQVFPEQASSYRAIDAIAFTCDSCSHQLGRFEERFEDLESKVTRFIQQKARNGTWTTPAQPT